jgi:hypothetical protein
VFQASLGVSVDVLAQRLALIEPFSGIKDLDSLLKEALGD